MTNTQKLDGLKKCLSLYWNKYLDEIAKNAAKKYKTKISVLRKNEIPNHAFTPENGNLGFQNRIHPNIISNNNVERKIIVNFV